MQVLTYSMLLLNFSEETGIHPAILQFMKVQRHKKLENKCSLEERALLELAQSCFAYLYGLSLEWGKHTILVLQTGDVTICHSLMMKSCMYSFMHLTTCGVTFPPKKGFCPVSISKSKNLNSSI